MDDPGKRISWCTSIADDCPSRGRCTPAEGVCAALLRRRAAEEGSETAVLFRSAAQALSMPAGMRRGTGLLSYRQRRKSESLPTPSKNSSSGNGPIVTAERTARRCIGSTEPIGPNTTCPMPSASSLTQGSSQTGGMRWGQTNMPASGQPALGSCAWKATVVEPALGCWGSSALGQHTASCPASRGARATYCRRRVVTVAAL